MMQMYCNLTATQKKKESFTPPFMSRAIAILSIPQALIPKSVPSSYDRRRDAHFEKDGGDLLSRLRSTIGAVGLNFSVRNGKRWNTNAIATIMGDMYGQLLFLSRAARPHAGRAQAYCDF